MDVSSSTASADMQTEAMKKPQEIQEKEAVKTIETATEQSKEVTAQKTGMGNSINITG